MHTETPTKYKSFMIEDIMNSYYLHLLALIVFTSVPKAASMFTGRCI